MQGLMDSDGCIGRRKVQSVYVSTVKQLAETVRELLWRLGIKNSMTESPSTRYGEPTGETLYTIRFTTFTDQPTSKLHRKICRKRERVKKTRSCFHYLENIEPLYGKIPMQCIQVDSTSHCYLAGESFVPTHNLAAAVALLLCCGDGEERADVYGCAADRQLSSTTDITAFVLVFPPMDADDKYAVLPHFWIPEDNIDLRVRRDHVPYDLWERQGFLQTTEGNVVHYGYIEKYIERLGERFNIREIAFDRWGAVQMVQNLEGMGFTVVPFGQGFASMSPPTKELMKLVLEQKIAHGGHPVLRWNMDNIFIRTDPAENIKADKAKSTEKIDGAIALIMALDRAIRCGNVNGESVYENRGLLVL